MLWGGGGLPRWQGSGTWTPSWGGGSLIASLLHSIPLWIGACGHASYFLN